MRTKGFLIAIGILTLTLGGMVSCGSSQQADNILDVPMESYAVEEEVVMDFDQELLSNSVVTDQYIYYVDTEDEGTDCLWKCGLNEQAAPAELFRLDSGEKLQIFTVTNQNNVIGVVAASGDADTRMELIKVEWSGRLLWRKEIPQESENISFISSLLVGSDYRIYVSTPQELLFFDEDGEYEGCVAAAGELIQSLTDAGEGRVSVVEYTKAGQKLTVYQAADRTEVFSRDFQNGRMWLKEGSGLYYPEIDVLMKYNWEDNSVQGIMNLTDCGIAISTVQVFKALEQDRFLFGIQSEGDQGMRFVWLTPHALQEEEASETAAEEQPKTRVVVASFNAQNLQNSIVNFNRSHSDYEMTCKSFDAATQRDMFNAYLVSADGPDVIDIFSYEAYFREGYLLDLKPFLENSEKVNTDDLLPRVLEDFDEDGKLYTIPRTIGITALACSTELLEGKDSWTIDEYLELLKRYPNALTEPGVSIENTKLEILYKTLYYKGVNGFVDYEAGRAAFDGEYFRSILSRIAELEVTTTDKSKEERAMEGETVLWQLSLYDTRGFQQAEWKNGHELTLIGFPVSGLVEGEKSSNYIYYNEMLGIHSDTENVEAAWDFVESYITGAFMPSNFFFRTGREAFEERMQAEMDIEPGTVDGVPYPPITEEQAGKVRNAFLEGRYDSGEDRMLKRIINEEVPPFFRGEKGLDEVVGIIQSRIQIYLDENM